MSSPAGTSSATYADNGWQVGRVLPNGATSTFGHNAVGALTSILNQTSGGSTLSQYSSFSYDGAFNLIGLTSSVPSFTNYSGATSYQYDSKDQLTQESTTRLGGITDSFAYDSAGNPTTLRGTTLTYNSRNQLTASGFTFDSSGNPTSYAGTSASFDPQNHMTSFGSLISAGYRADGQRAWSSNSSATTYYFYDGGVPVYETDASGNITAKNVYAPDGLVGRYQGSAWIQYLFDPQGNVSERLDTSASILSESAYNAFGQEASSTSHSDPFGFNARSGYYTDQSTGLVLCGQRYYDPAYGRFLNRDPIGFAGGVNLYSYIGNGPIGFSDPSGLTTWHDIACNIRSWGQDQGALISNYWSQYGPVGDAVASLTNQQINSTLGAVTGFMDMGGGSGKFVGDPSWKNAPGMIMDVAKMALFVLGGAEMAGTASAIDADAAAMSAARDPITDISVSKGRFGEAARHMEDAQNAGHPDVLTVARDGAKANRAEAMRGVDPISGLDRDEYPPAMFEEGGQGSSVRHIDPSSNRSLGGYVGQACRGLPNGAKVRLVITP